MRGETKDMLYKLQSCRVYILVTPKINSHNSSHELRIGSVDVYPDLHIHLSPVKANLAANFFLSIKCLPI